MKEVAEREEGLEAPGLHLTVAGCRALPVLLNAAWETSSCSGGSAAGLGLLSRDVVQGAAWLGQVGNVPFHSAKLSGEDTKEPKLCLRSVAILSLAGWHQQTREWQAPLRPPSVEGSWN